MLRWVPSMLGARPVVPGPGTRPTVAAVGVIHQRGEGIPEVCRADGLLSRASRLGIFPHRPRHRLRGCRGTYELEWIFGRGSPAPPVADIPSSRTGASCRQVEYERHNYEVERSSYQRGPSFPTSKT
jgi:hypothetical protein